MAPRALFAEDAVARALAAAAAVGVRLPWVVRCAPAAPTLPSSSSADLPFPRRVRDVRGGSARSMESSGSSASPAFGLAARRLIVAVAGATSTSTGWPRLAPRRILFAGSGSRSGSGSGAVVAGTFVPRAVLRVGLLDSAGSWSVDSEDFVVVRERRPGSSLDAAGFGCAGGSLTSLLALLTDLAGAGATS